MIKFIDILKEQEEIIEVPKLDTPTNRKLMNIISKKFDFDYFRQQADKWSLGHKSHILFNRYMKGDDKEKRKQVLETFTGINLISPFSSR